MSGVIAGEESREAKRRRRAGDPLVVVAAAIVPDVAASASSESSEADAVAAATDLPTGAAVAKQLGYFDLARDGLPLARAGALRALKTMDEWASDDESYVAFSVYFQRYGGPARVLDFLKENMVDAELVELVCAFIAICSSDNVAENCLGMANANRKLFVDLEGIQTFLLANDEHFATNTDSSLKAAASIWWCLWNTTWEEQATLVVDAACVWLEKLSTLSFTTTSHGIDLLDSLLGALSSQMTKSFLKSRDIKTRKIILKALKAVLPTIGKWKKPAWKQPALNPGGICAFFSECSKKKDLLTHSQFQDLLPIYVEALEEYPLETNVYTWTISFFENASSVVDKQVMKRSGVCVALSQFDNSDATEDHWKERARKLVMKLFK